MRICPCRSLIGVMLGIFLASPDCGAQTAAGPGLMRMDAFDVSRPAVCNNIPPAQRRESDWIALDGDGGIVALPNENNDAAHVLFVGRGNPALEYRLVELTGKTAGVEVQTRDASGNPHPGAFDGFLFLDGRHCKGDIQNQLGIALLKADGSVAEMVESAADPKAAVAWGTLKHLSAYALAVP